jgi:translation initiation factor IF-2
MIVLQAEMMDLHADISVPAKAFLLESRLDKGFGAIATVICLEGTLKQGDYFSCGDTTGKVRLILNSAGERVVQTGPSSPVQIVGFDKLPLPADVLSVITAEQYNKAKTARKPEVAGHVQTQRVSLNTDEKSTATKIKLIIKCDNFGSKEAIEGSIATMSKKNKDMAERLQLVAAGVGDITESDVDLAENTGSRIVGFHVRAEKNAASYAREHDIEIALYQVIYHLTEALEALVKQPKKAIITITKAGEAVVLKVFPLKDNTVIAGCQITNGVFGRNGKVICFRRGAKVGEGRIVSLQRDRKSVKEVHSGFECGFITDDFHEWQVNDVVHFMMETKEIPVD